MCVADQVETDRVATMSAFGPRVRLHYLERIEMRSVHVWERASTRRIFCDVERAVSFLMVGWPREYRDTPKHWAAQIAALEALDGGSAETFRSAFMEAAEEAGILAERSLVPTNKDVSGLSAALVS